MNFIFYDTEATGPEPLHDQMLHVAAVLTDADLTERDCFGMRCRLRPHQLPTPLALLLTGLTIEAITNPALPSHDEMVHALRNRFLAWQPAIFTGYSSLEFDENLLAQSLCECLLPSRLTASAGSGRLDVQRLALAVHTFIPGAIAFTTRHDGAPSFRLSEIARANGISHHNAHDALADVRTTLALARLIRVRVPWLWDHMVRMGREEEALNFAESAPVRLYTEFNHNRPHHWLVTALGRGGSRSGDLIGFDLAQDPARGQELEGEALRRWLARHPKPLRPIKVADCPFILPREHARGLAGMDDPHDPELDRRAALLSQNEAYRARLITAHHELEREPAVNEEAVAAPPEFHAASWEKRLEMAMAFVQPALRVRALRLVFTERPELLDQATRAGFEAEIAARLLREDKTPWMTLSKAFDGVDAAFEHAATEDVPRLEGLLSYLRRELAWAERAISRG